MGVYVAIRRTQDFTKFSRLIDSGTMVPDNKKLGEEMGVSFKTSFTKKLPLLFSISLTFFFTEKVWASCTPKNLDYPDCLQNHAHAVDGEGYIVKPKNQPAPKSTSTRPSPETTVNLPSGHKSAFDSDKDPNYSIGQEAAKNQPQNHTVDPNQNSREQITGNTPDGYKAAESKPEETVVAGETDEQRVKREAAAEKKRLQQLALCESNAKANKEDYRICRKTYDAGNISKYTRTGSDVLGTTTKQLLDAQANQSLANSDTPVKDGHAAAGTAADTTALVTGGQAIINTAAGWYTLQSAHNARKQMDKLQILRNACDVNPKPQQCTEKYVKGLDNQIDEYANAIANAKAEGGETLIKGTMLGAAAGVAALIGKSNWDQYKKMPGSICATDPNNVACLKIRPTPPQPTPTIVDGGNSSPQVDPLAAQTFEDQGIDNSNSNANNDPVGNTTPGGAWSDNGGSGSGSGAPAPGLGAGTMANGTEEKGDGSGDYAKGESDTKYKATDSKNSQGNKGANAVAANMSKDDPFNLDLKALQDLLPKFGGDDADQASILDRRPASANDTGSFLDASVDIFERVAKTYQESQRKKRVGI